MAWDLETAKGYLKIDPADTSKDAVIQGVMDYVFGSVETVLQRGLLFLRQTVVYQYVDVNRLYLPRFPVANVFEVKDGNENLVSEYILHSRVGWIEFPQLPLSPVKITYDGGYQILPFDLERVLWEAFMDAWDRTDPDTGGPLESGGASGDVKSLTVFDGFKVDYESMFGQDSLSSREQNQWGWLAPWASTLGFYRSIYGTGLGIA